MSTTKTKIAVVDYIGPGELRGYAIATYDPNNKGWSAAGCFCSSAQTAVMGANPNKLRLYNNKKDVLSVFAAQHYDIDWFIDAPTTSDMAKA